MCCSTLRMWGSAQGWPTRNVCRDMGSTKASSPACTTTTWMPSAPCKVCHARRSSGQKAETPGAYLISSQKEIMHVDARTQRLDASTVHARTPPAFMHLACRKADMSKASMQTLVVCHKYIHGTLCPSPSSCRSLAASWACPKSPCSPGEHYDQAEWMSTQYLNALHSESARRCTWEPMSTLARCSSSSNASMMASAYCL